MKVVVEIDPDAVARLRHLARKREKSEDEVVNDLINEEWEFTPAESN